MRKLLPQFADRRVCAHCGAPAARLGRVEVGHAAGERTFRFITDTVERVVPVGFPGSIRVVVPQPDKTFNRGGVEKAIPQPPVDVYIVTYTHECTRHEPLHDVTDPTDLLSYQSCGLLTRASTRDAKQLPDECYHEDLAEHQQYSQPSPSHSGDMRQIAEVGA